MYWVRFIRLGFYIQTERNILIMGKHSHLFLSQRSDIEIMLSKKMSFNKIALAIGKDNTTVSKEIKKT